MVPNIPQSDRPLRAGQAYRADGGQLVEVDESELDSVNPKPVSASGLTEKQKNQLRELGWKDGDPLPSDFASRIREIRERLRAESTDIRETELFKKHWKEGTDKDTPAKGLDELDPKEAAEVRRLLSNYQRALKTGEDVDELMGDYPEKRRRPAAVPAAEPDTDDVTGVDEMKKVIHCDRCMWRQDLKWPFDAITSEDKQAFVSSLLPGRRYRKTIRGMGGHVSLTFRTLTARERETIQTQLAFQLRTGQIIGDVAWSLWEHMYRMALMLEAFTVGNATTNYPDYKGWCEKLNFNPNPVIPEEKDGKKPDLPDPTAVRQILQTIEEQIDHEPLLQLMQQEYRNFQGTYETIIARSNEPDFFSGIGSQL